MTATLGVVADDVTGAVDLAGAVAAVGLATTVHLGVPPVPAAGPATGCDVIALTTRTRPAGEAVASSLAAARWLLAGGHRLLYQKYCSTFDSTDRGNIGPVADALRALVPGGAASVGTPATPAVGRTQYLGHLFVGDRLLSESSLRDHPLTPMRDPDLVRVLSRQTPHRVALLPWTSVRGGPAAIGAELARADGVAHLLVDALTDADLDHVAAALLAERPARNRLLGGGAGLAAALARALAPLEPVEGTDLPAVPRGRSLILSGSCSERTREQVRHCPGPRLDLEPEALVRDPAAALEQAGEWLVRVWADDPGAVPAVSTTADPARVRAVQSALGTERAAQAVEQTLGGIAARAVADLGVRRLLVAGGETSGAVTTALGVSALRVARQVAPGLSWTISAGDPHLAILPKSGNFGADDLFRTAWEVAP